MAKVRLAGGQVATVDEQDIERVLMVKWHLSKRGLVQGSVPGGKGKKCYLHRFILSAPSHLQVDHINGDRLDNRRENLRLCTDGQNKRNIGKRSNNTSGYKGVTTHNGRYRATIVFHYRQVCCGHYRDTAREAARDYDYVARQLHGEFARLNDV